MNMDFKRKLPIPMEIKQQYPLTPELKAIKDKRDEEIKDVITGKSNKFLVIIGPCSADNEDSVCDYFGWTYCSSISFYIEEILDCDYYDYNDMVITDRDRLEEIIEDRLYDDYHDKPEEEYEAAIKDKITELEPYWKKVIAIYATN